MNGISVEACAKVNLFLRILGLRPDGFHELWSVAQSISLADRLDLEPAPGGIQLEVDGDPEVPSGPDNLVHRAAVRMLGHDPHPGVAMTLVKRIPHGAGLGGGSSDAAAALLGIDRMFGLGTPSGTLREHAAALGSDVPFFLEGGTAVLRGRGTEIEALPDGPHLELLILDPRRPLSTALVYAQVQEPLTLAGKTASIPGFGRIPQDPLSRVRLGNDLETHAARLCPDIPEMRRLLLEGGARVAAMTGSGSAVFGLFDRAETAQEAAGRAEQRGFRALPCRTLHRSEVGAGRFSARAPGVGPSGGAGHGDHRRPGVPCR
ncbi:MAG TPA: 4-(cytidine 5'-diphospho)-2-C-methyl-D-erythritol kinase [Candidatus Polarisedimenticolia bacterium]|nr:4-(cytidine 5'-diphospho)-2-C-methyl-D-erythritol kinase [Candidatus Polarisedimenticolia bacterium]